MRKTLSKAEAKKQIENFFVNIKKRGPKEIKKIKRLAMAYNLPLGKKRRLFCRKCLMPYLGKEKIRIKNRIKSISCENCGYISRLKI